MKHPGLDLNIGYNIKLSNFKEWNHPKCELEKNLTLFYISGWYPCTVANFNI